MHNHPAWIDFMDDYSSRPKSRKAMPENIAWIDVETTGLDPKYNDILEIAIVPFPDADYPVLNMVVRPVYPWEPENAKAYWDTEVYEMHKESGLLDDVYSDKAVPLDEAVNATKMFITQHCQGMRLGGRTVAFDRGFLNYFIGKGVVDNRLDYHDVDVSAIRYFMKDSLGEEVAYPKTKHHRALDDIRDTIAEYRHYQSLVKYLYRG